MKLKIYRYVEFESKLKLLKVFIWLLSCIYDDFGFIDERIHLFTYIKLRIRISQY